MRRSLTVCLLPMLLLAAPLAAKSKKPQPKPAPTPVVSAAVEDAAKATVLHHHEYAIAFDPHPTTYEPLGKQPVKVGGKSVTYRVELLEGWSADATPVLQDIGARVTLFVAGQPQSMLLFPKTRVEATRATKGLSLGEQRSGSLGARVVITTPLVDHKKLIAVTVATDLLSFGDAAAPPAAAAPAPAQPNDTGNAQSTTETAEAAPATSPAAGSGEAPDTGSIRVEAEPTAPVSAPAGSSRTAIAMARSLIAKADAMTTPATQAARAQLLRRALTVLGDATAPEALDLAAQVRDKLAAAGAPATTVASPAPAPGSTPSATPAAATANTTVNTPSAQPMRADVKALLDEAERKFAEGNDKDGFDLMHQATWKDPTSHEAWVRVGRKAYSVQEYKEARDAFDHAVALRTDDADSALMSAKAGVYVADEGRGIDQLLRMVQQHPDKVAVRLALAEAFYFAANYSSCEAECLKILEKFPGNTHALELLNKARDRTK